MANDMTDNENGLPPKLDLSKRVNANKPENPKAPVASGSADALKEDDKTKSPLSVNMAAPSDIPEANPKSTSSGTMRITLDPDDEAAVKPTTPPGSVRIKPRPLNAAGGESSDDGEKKSSTARIGLKPKSVRLKPVAIGIKREGPEANAPVGSKRETSKIPLQAAIPTAVNAAPTKTIKIKPALPTNMKKPDDKPAADSEPEKQEAPEADPKRQTSRISLDAALGGEGENKQAAGPKTIRLKRPSEVATVKIKKKPEVEDNKAGEPLNKTSEIPPPEAEGDKDEIPQTQKKTIKVKRPSQRRAVKSVSVKRAGSEAGATEPAAEGAVAAAPMQAVGPAAAPVKDGAHWTFITASVAAIIVCCIIIYVLCAQVLGPNISLTQLSYAAPDAELPWPGRITR